MIDERAAWGILFLPLASFFIISFIVRPLLNQYRQISGYLAILSIGSAFILSLWALSSTVSGLDTDSWSPHTWLSIGDLEITLGIMLDPLTSIMLVVITGVSLAVQVYSQGYMKGDPGYSRYFAYMSLFTASMLGLVLAKNIIQLYAFWELVGLCSYLLIGFWYQRPSAVNAAKKAFIVTRIGDFGFLLAILYLFLNRGVFLGLELNPFWIPDINEIAKIGGLASDVVTWVALGLFAGAIGKSAQFPLHVWLPDAMEGPTPVSALIHAATMVVAGVFLVARFFDLFHASHTAMDTVALIGGITAIFAATMGLVMHDIKKVLAYSTVSQLGFMMLALGVGAYGAAIFHLFNHAFFKALLFLGSGSVNHATGTFDMRYMGGLRKHMPLTYGTFLIGALSIAGIFPLSGFWSKDEILLGVSEKGGFLGNLLFWLALIAAFMTAFYIFRVLFMTFHGEFRGGADADPNPPPGEHHVHLAESPMIMWLPMAILAIPSVISGFLANPISNIWGLGLVPNHWFSEYLYPSQHAAVFDIKIALGSLLVAMAGIGLAYLMYYSKSISSDKLVTPIRPLYEIIYNKYYFDNVYEGIFIKKVFYEGIAKSIDWIDKNIIDRVGEILGFIGRNLGKPISALETGQVQLYGGVISFGIVLILILLVI
jgi:NADH-quinone oxidoreductase subunit L